MHFHCEWKKSHFDDLVEFYEYLLKHKAKSTIIYLQVLVPIPVWRPTITGVIKQYNFQWENWGKTRHDWYFSENDTPIITELRDRRTYITDCESLSEFGVIFVFKGSFKKKLFAKKILIEKIKGSCTFDINHFDNKKIMSVLEKPV